ncbi:condensin-2 complex subunit G2 isoform X3 [Nelusetta ayraudi]|uniref:condensin-2 complex subunit G2 isoform X3 n=1 Tax=Nelusetta ayraudi TaxID=303726 RepID=UPI003F70F2C3
MSKREEFVDAASKENAEEFLRFIRLHKDKAEPFDVAEVMQEMSRGQVQTLWGKLAALLEDILQELPPEHWEDSGEEGMDVKTAADPKHVMAVVHGVALVAATSLEALQDGHSYSALLQIAHMLHDVLVALPISESPLQLQILTLFEAWWKKDLKEKEKFALTALLVALKKSVSLKKMAAEIQRVWNLHDVLLSVDYAAEETKGMINLLEEGFVQPSFFQNDNGKRFLVFLFSWNVDFIWAIHATIKNQLHYLSKPMIKHLIEIYYRAWKKATGEFKEKIESVCIQDYMKNAILLHRSSPVISKVRMILYYFHSKKGCDPVEKMLNDLYKPILWKSLSVPNFEVRANAAHLLTEAFPLHDPAHSPQAVEAAIQKQLDMAMTLLDDPDPTVRCIATLGVCKILTKCWELLPPVVIVDFLKKLAKELANDTSSEEVRCSVFKCLAIVLNNPLSHPALEEIVVTLKNGLHDKSEMVRAAFLDLLIKMKEVRAAKFWDVCTIEHLLARLAIDTQCICKRITNLLLKSFFPLNESEAEWSRRCVTLIQMNPMAARKFYLYVHLHLDPTNIVKMMLAIHGLVNRCIEIDLELPDADKGEKENSEQAEPPLGKDVAVMSGLLEIVVVLWKTVTSSLQKNKEAQKYIFEKFGNVMPTYFEFFMDKRCTVALVELASLMPPAAVPTFSCGVLSKLRRMDPMAAPKEYEQLLDCLCSWGQAGSILELLTDWLTEALPDKPKKARSRQKVPSQETVEAKPGLALAYLEHLFSCPSEREKVLDVDERQLTQLHTALERWMSVLSIHLDSSTKDPHCPNVETALGVFTFHGRLSVHLQHKDSSGSREYLASLERVAAWVAERVLPFLAQSGHDGEAMEEETTALAAHITKTFLTVCRDVLLVGVGDEELMRHILHLCSLTLPSEAGHLCIPVVLSILNEVVSSYVPEGSWQDADEAPAAVALGVVANIFQKVIEVMALRLKKEPEEGKKLCQSAVPGLEDFLEVAHIWKTAPLVGVFSTLLAIIIVEKRHLLQKMTHPEEVIMPESADDMPPLSSVLLSVMLKSPSVTRAFLDEVSSSLDSEANSSLTEVVAVLHVLAVVKHTGHCEAALKEAAISLQRHLNGHAVTSVDGTDVQRVMYASSEKTLNEILSLRRPQPEVC